MKKMLKVLKYIFLLLVIGIAGFLSYVKFALPNVGKPEDIKVELTPERIERGKYLANSVCVCMDCHSTRDWNKFSGPLVEGTYGKGGEEFNQKLGFPGKFVAKNITPFGIGKWTDGELLRAISSGVNKDGKALFPIMPHPNYGKMDREDLYSIIAYLRTLTPIESTLDESEPDFPMNFIINSMPAKAEFSVRPDTSDILAYGKYLFTSASCNDCHTRQEKGKPVAGMESAGGFKFPLLTGGVVISANITPDVETGIGKWSETEFVNKFRGFADSLYAPTIIKKGEFNSFMPWVMYGQMKESDLKAIYAYMRTIKSVKNVVVKFDPNETIN